MRFRTISNQRPKTTSYLRRSAIDYNRKLMINNRPITSGDISYQRQSLEIKQPQRPHTGTRTGDIFSHLNRRDSRNRDAIIESIQNNNAIEDNDCRKGNSFVLSESDYILRDEELSSRGGLRTPFFPGYTPKTEVSKTLTASQGSAGVSDGTNDCCHGPNKRPGNNNQDKGIAPIRREMAFIRQKTITNFTIGSAHQKTPSKKFETSEDIILKVDETTKHESISRCSYTSFPEIDSRLTKSLPDNYYGNPQASDSEGTESSQDLYVTSSSSEAEDNSGGTAESELYNEKHSIPQSHAKYKKKNIIARKNSWRYRNQKQAESNRKRLESLPGVRISKCTTAMQADFIKGSESPERFINVLNRSNVNTQDGVPHGLVYDDERPDKNSVSLDDYSTPVSAYKPNSNDYRESKQHRYPARNMKWNPGKIDTTLLKSGNSTSDPSPPPSAMKKSRSASSGSNGKKHKVQFDLDIEVHFVPRESSVPTPCDSVENDFSHLDLESQDADDESYGDFPVHKDSGEDLADLRDLQNCKDQPNEDNAQDLNIPFKVIKRETPTGTPSSRRGRRDSYDLIQMQKLLSKQMRERSSRGQGVATDHELRHSRQGRQNRKVPSPPKVPQSPYYPSREYRRYVDEAKSQTKMNAMSPEHYVAFYTRQQQLQQYLDYERRLRRQQLLSGNMKYKGSSRSSTVSHKNVDSGNESLNRNSEETDRNEESDESGDERLPKVGSASLGPLTKPKPHIQASSSHGKRTSSQEEQFRLSSGYAGSNADCSDTISKNEGFGRREASKSEGSSKHTSQISLNARIIESKPFTPRQVAEVMRAAGVRGQGEDITYYSERHRRRRNDEDVKQGSQGRHHPHKETHTRGSPAPHSGTFAKLSFDARKALQNAHMDYAASLKELKPSAKSISEFRAREVKDEEVLKSKPPPMPPLGSEYRLASLGQPIHPDAYQNTVRYRHGIHRGKMPDNSFPRQKRSDGARLGSGHMASCGSIASSNVLANGLIRPETAESVTVNMLGLSARLPLNSRRSAKDNKSYAAARQIIPVRRTNGNHHHRNSTGAIPSKVPPVKQKRHSQNSHHRKKSETKHSDIYDHESTVVESRRRVVGGDPSRPVPPQLRGPHYPSIRHSHVPRPNASGHPSSSSLVVPTKIFA